MVYTRSQKRGNEDTGEQGDNQSSLKVNDDYSGVSIHKKKRAKNEPPPPKDSPKDLEEEIDFITETETEELNEEDLADQKEEKSNIHENDEAKVTEINLKPKQVQKVIQEAIKQLIKRYDDDDRDFMEEDNGSEKSDEYDTFIEYINGISSGEFFERIPIEERKKRLRSEFSEEEIKKFNTELEELHKLYKESAPSIIDILKMNVHASQKQKLLEKMHHYTNSDILTGEYNSTLKYLMTNIKKTNEPELFQLEQEIMRKAQSDELSDDYRKKILVSQMPFDNKVIAYKRLEIMERYEESDSSEFAKYKNWMDILLAVPFGKYITVPKINEASETEIHDYIGNVRKVLDKRLSFLEKPKDQIINIVSHMIRNPNTNLNAIGLYGSKGLGKTRICESIAEALGRPYRVISLGGESDASLLTGHGFTYVGSTPGRIIDILTDTKCMNSVILFDELDKVSQSHHGKEIIGNLIHLTDSTTNHKYNYDRYFAGVEFDLSKVLFVFTYNDPTKVDKILADRLFKIKVDNYTIKEKLEITNKHIIKDTLDKYNFTSEQITFAEDAINYIIQEGKNDEGMRDIKRRFEIIISRINTLMLTQEQTDIIRLKYSKLSNYYKQFPVQVLKEHIDILLAESTSNDLDVSNPPFGMYI